MAIALITMPFSPQERRLSGYLGPASRTSSHAGPFPDRESRITFSASTGFNDNATHNVDITISNFGFY